MQTAVSSAAKTQGDDAHAKPSKFYKRIGSTTYVVAVHFSRTSKETLEDKLLRLMEREARDIA